MMTDTAAALTFAADSIATGLVLNAPSEIVEGVEIATDALAAVPTEFAAEAERIRALLPEINDALEQPVFDAFAAETKRIRAALASGQLRPVPRMLDELVPRARGKGFRGGTFPDVQAAPQARRAESYHHAQACSQGWTCRHGCDVRRRWCGDRHHRRSPVERQ